MASVARSTSTALVRSEPPPEQPGRTLFDLLQARFAAHAICFAANSELMVLRARAEVADARRETEEAEQELAFRRELASSSPATAQRKLRQEVVTQELLLRRELLRQHRRGTPLPSQSVTALAWNDGEDRLEPEITQQQIDTLALRAITPASSCSDHERRAFWPRWRSELKERLPRYAADEVAARAEELAALMGGDLT